ncbi:MAG: insulinase family protein [Clostridia bacterium]|nr:insulinase family protein [Clostridia bacterium]
MNIEIGTVINNFKVERIRESAELNGRFVEMHHVRTGTELCWMDNGDSNKLFCVGFKTLPEDSTGVFHILEHSVLCGSDKYPVKEPFVDLMKSSMNTFLNAMTFQDKTIYPVSSRNDKDFLNLTSVYLDAVFAPRSVKDPNAFRQEGWHLEIGEDGKPFINGVVYNEMKGATSGLDDTMYEGLQTMLFPDNCNGWNSGGDPVHIPDLTYEQYCAMYHKYYHPSNARIFLDGAVPLEETLDLIDTYVGGVEKQPSEFPIPMQQIKPAKKTVCYEIGADETEEGKAVIGFGKIIGTYADKRRLMMAGILCDYLAETNDSPLSRAILDAGLGENVELYTGDDTQQATLLLFVRNTNAENADAIRARTEEVVNGLLEKGLDKELLTGYLNQKAFRVKDMREPAGLIRCIMSYQSSLYGGDPMLYLENNADIEALRESVKNGEFEQLLRELLLDFDHMSVLTVLPSKTHGEKLRAEEAERAEKLFNALSEKEVEELKAANERLHAWQQQPDSEEATKTLPVLPLSEVGEEPLYTKTEVVENSGIKVLYHAIPTNGINHVNMYFALTDLAADELPAAGVMAQLLSKLPTKKHSAAELQKLIKTYIGKLGFSVKASMEEPENCTPYFIASFSCLEENMKQASGIVAEILTETVFGEANKIGEIMLQLDEETKQRAIMAGHQFGMYAVNSHYLSSAVVADAVSGYTFRSYVKKLARAFSENSGKLIGILEKVQKDSFVRARLTIGEAAVTMPCPMALVEALPEGTPAPEKVHYESVLPKRLGVRIPAQVSFAEKGIYVPDLDGRMKVVSTIVGLSCLWNRVRVQGGAYGAGLVADQSGIICNYSYRDPSPARSIGVYDEEAEFIKEFCGGKEDLTKFIISTVGETEPLRSPGEICAAADMDHLCGRTYGKVKAFRKEMLGTTRESMLALVPVFTDCAENGVICVVGCDSALAEFDDLTVFDA